MKKTSLIVIALCVMLICCSCGLQPHEQTNINDDIIVEVNGDPILNSEVLPVYHQYSGTDISYEKIVEDSISELLVIQKAADYGVTLSEDAISGIVDDYKSSYPDYFNEAIETYGEDEVRFKLKNMNLYSLTKQYVLDNILEIDDKIINSFKKQSELNSYLDDYANEYLMETLNEEIKEYAFLQWIDYLRSEATIKYYDENLISTEDNIIIINELSDYTDSKFDGEKKTVNKQDLTFDFINGIKLNHELISEKFYEVYIKENFNSNQYTVLRHYEIEYNFEEQKSIHIKFSPKDYLLNDYFILSDNVDKSIINQVVVYIYEYQNQYIVEFLHDDINFWIESTNLIKNELVQILESIVN